MPSTTAAEKAAAEKAAAEKAAAEKAAAEKAAAEKAAAEKAAAEKAAAEKAAAEKAAAELAAAEKAAAELAAEATESRMVSTASDVMDDSMRFVFFVGAIFSIFYLPKIVNKTKEVAKPVMDVVGCGWNFFDVVGGLIVGINGLLKARDAKRNQTRKRLVASLDIVGSLQLAAGTAITTIGGYNAPMLASTALTAKMAAAFGPFSFTICMLLATIKEGVALHYAIKKTNMLYLLEDRLIKYRDLKEKNSDLFAAEPLTAEQTLKKQKIDKKLEMLKLQAVAITRVEKETVGVTEVTSRYFTENEVNGLAHDASDDDKQLVDFLKNKQNEKVRRHALGVAAWTLATVGMGLIAVATAVACPQIVLTAGILITAISAVLKLSEVWRNRKNEALKATQKEYLNNYKDNLANVPKRSGRFCSLSLETRKKMKMAYELKAEPKKEKIQEACFYKTLMKYPWYKRQRVLNNALKQCTENKVIKVIEEMKTKGFKIEPESLSANDRKAYLEKYLNKDRVQSPSEENEKDKSHKFMVLGHR